MVFLVSAELAYQVITPEGASGDGFFVCGPPVYHYLKGGVCTFFLNITYPLNGSNFYTPNISPNITMNITGTVSPLCYYETGGSWNFWNCSEGINSKVITLPEGYPTTIQVRVDDTCGSVTTEVQVNVHYRHGGGGNINWRLFIALLLFLLIIVLLDDEDEKLSK